MATFPGDTGWGNTGKWHYYIYSGTAIRIEAFINRTP